MCCLDLLGLPKRYRNEIHLGGVGGKGFQRLNKAIAGDKLLSCV